MNSILLFVGPLKVIDMVKINMLRVSAVTSDCYSSHMGEINQRSFEIFLLMSLFERPQRSYIVLKVIIPTIYDTVYKDSTVVLSFHLVLSTSFITTSNISASPSTGTL